MQNVSSVFSTSWWTERVALYGSTTVSDTYKRSKLSGVSVDAERRYLFAWDRVLPTRGGWRDFESVCVCVWGGGTLTSAPYTRRRSALSSMLKRIHRGPRGGGGGRPLGPPCWICYCKANVFVRAIILLSVP